MIDRFIQSADAIEIISKKAIIVLGGAGSGNFGHQGRPGEVGGSVSAEMTLADQAIPDSLRMKLGASEELKLSRAVMVLRGAANRADFPLEKVHVKAYERSFVVGNKTFTEGGHFNPGTGEILLNANTLSHYDAHDAEVMFRHEVSHRDWNDVKNALELEPGGPSVIDESDLSSSAKTIRDILSEKGSILEKDDGISDYSRSYWRDVPKWPDITPYPDAEHRWIDNNTGEVLSDAGKDLLLKRADIAFEDYDDKFLTAVNETLAVISQQDLDRAFGNPPNGKTTFDPSPTWRELHTAVVATAKELRKRGTK